MSYYNYMTEGKTSASFAEDKNHRLEGSVELAPNIDYKVQNVYQFDGLGSVFDGTYKIKKLVRKIDTSGMSVSGNVIQLKSGKSNKPKPKEGEEKKAETKTKANKEYTVKKGDTLQSIATAMTGSASNWKAIEQANHAKLVASNKNNSDGKGNWIYPNQKITIPGNLLKP